jgi:superfamily I DNA/RNA helicase
VIYREVGVAALPTPIGRQHDVVYMPAKGHQVVLGTAGSGKTVMAIHRAVHLANPSTPGHGRVLLLTFTNSLVAYLAHLADGHHHNITVETCHKFARGYLNSQGRMGFNSIADAHMRRILIRKAVDTVAKSYKPGSFFERPLDFFDDELDWIDGQGLTTLNDYLAIARIGRMAPLAPASRKAIWRIRQETHALLGREGKTYMWSMIPTAVLDALANDASVPQYRHVVIDEAQDLSPEAIRSAAALIPPDGSLTVFADYAQQIYGQRVSWRSCGLKVRREEHFKDNYRNTREIAQLALAMASMPHFKDVPDLVEPIAPNAAGAKPTIVRCADAAAEAQLVAKQAAEFGKYARVGVLTHTRHEARMATSGLSGVRVLHENLQNWDDSAGIWAGTYHSGKGLEFDVVILPFCSADRLPSPEVVDAFGDQEAAARESRLLYVGVTRSRRELLITYHDKLTELMPAIDSGFYTVAKP